MHTRSTPRLLSIGEVAVLLGVTARSVRRLAARDAEFPVARISARIQRVPADKLTDYIDARATREPVTTIEAGAK